MAIWNFRLSVRAPKGMQTDDFNIQLQERTICVKGTRQSETPFFLLQFTKGPPFSSKMTFSLC